MAGRQPPSLLAMFHQLHGDLVMQGAVDTRQRLLAL
jgi:hypothetical protein